MKRRFHACLVLAAALGLSGVMACSATNTPGTDTSQAGAGTGGGVADAATGTDAGGGAQRDAAAPFQITECNLGQTAAIALALVNQGLQAANLALSTSTNASVKAFAQQVVNADTAFLQQLQGLGVTPVASDISTAITTQTTLILNSLRTSANFDRDYVAGVIIGDMTALGFAEHVTANDASSAQQTALKTAALTLVQTQVQAAFMLQADLVGACGTPGADAGACGDASMAQ